MYIFTRVSSCVCLLALVSLLRWSFSYPYLFKKKPTRVSSARKGRGEVSDLRARPAGLSFLLSRYYFNVFFFFLDQLSAQIPGTREISSHTRVPSRGAVSEWVREWARARAASATAPREICLLPRAASRFFFFFLQICFVYLHNYQLSLQRPSACVVRWAFREQQKSHFFRGGFVSRIRRGKKTTSTSLSSTTTTSTSLRKVKKK